MSRAMTSPPEPTVRVWAERVNEPCPVESCKALIGEHIPRVNLLTSKIFFLCPKKKKRFAHQEGAKEMSDTKLFAEHHLQRPECSHGSLARSCERCDASNDIKEIESLFIERGEKLRPHAAELDALKNESGHLKSQLNTTHEQVAAMCEHLDPNETQPRDTWGLRDLILGQERHMDALRTEVAELRRRLSGSRVVECDAIRCHFEAERDALRKELDGECSQLHIAARRELGVEREGTRLALEAGAKEIFTLKARLERALGALKDVGCLDPCECHGCHGGGKKSGWCCVCEALFSRLTSKPVNCANRPIEETHRTHSSVEISALETRLSHLIQRIP